MSLVKAGWARKLFVNLWPTRLLTKIKIKYTYIYIYIYIYLTSFYANETCLRRRRRKLYLALQKLSDLYGPMGLWAYGGYNNRTKKRNASLLVLTIKYYQDHQVGEWYTRHVARMKEMEVRHRISVGKTWISESIWKPGRPSWFIKERGVIWTEWPFLRHRIV
jgi:hypothetical protein